MNIPSIFLLSLFFTSQVLAHPNHMTFEDMQHSVDQDKNISSIQTPYDNHITIKEETGHKNETPCTDQQHKAEPCKKK